MEIRIGDDAENKFSTAAKSVPSRARPSTAQMTALTLTAAQARVGGRDSSYHTEGRVEVVGDVQILGAAK